MAQLSYEDSSCAQQWLRTMQIILDFPGTPEDYISQNVHLQVSPPGSCPRCTAINLESLGYYNRGITAAGSSSILVIPIKRFRCRACKLNLSFLPSFAQPYRLVRNSTVQTFFDGSANDADATRWGHLLRRYWRRFCMGGAISFL
jgi:hypothetical protein